MPRAPTTRSRIHLQSRITAILQRSERALADSEIKYLVASYAFAETEDALKFMAKVGILSYSKRLTVTFGGIENINNYYWLTGRDLEIPGIDPSDRLSPVDFVPTPEQERLLEAGAMVADPNLKLTRSKLAEALDWPKSRVTVILKPIRLANAWPYRWSYGSMPDSVAESRLSIARELKSHKHGLQIYDCEFDIAFGEAV